MDDFRKRFPESAIFTASARIINPSEEDRFVAKASIQPLRSLLPSWINPEDNPDLLYIASNGAVAGLCNRNGDCLDAETAIRVHRTAATKFISVEHDRKYVVGVVLHPGLTRFGSNEPLTDEQAAQLKEPFNLAFAGALWKVIDNKLARYIRKVDGALDEDALSVSWEILISEWCIGVGSKNLWDCRRVCKGDPQFDDLVPRLKAKGGNGKSPAGEDIFRIITGDAIILGYSIVASPAAEVKGILPILPAPVEQPVAAQSSEAAEASSASMDTPATSDESTAAAPENAVASAPTLSAESALASAPEATPPSEKIITPTESRVTPRNAPMKIESFDQLTAQWSEFSKLDSAVAVASIEAFKASFDKANEKFLADLNAQKDLAASLEQAKAAADQKTAELEASLANVNAQLQSIQAAAVAAEQDRKFQERMASFDEEYTLDDEDRQIIASDIKGLNDEAFAAYQKKCSKLMCAKKKGASTAAASTAATAPTDTDGFAQAFASVTATPGQASVPPGQVKTDASLSDEMEEAFGSAIKIGGKTVKERRAEKAAKAPKE